MDKKIYMFKLFKTKKNLILIIIHHIVLASAIVYYGFDIWVALAILFLSMMWSKVVGSDIMHFYFAHSRYKDSLKSYFYTFLTLFSGLGSPLSYAVTHRQHHKYVDTEEDPHSPEIIGWKRVYFLDWKPQRISPRLIEDFSRSKFQKVIHRHYFKIHVTLLALFLAIDLRIVCFLLSPFIIYSFHNAGAVNVLGHLGGESKNVPLLRVINWWRGWDHGDHHNYKFTK